MKVSQTVLRKGHHNKFQCCLSDLHTSTPHSAENTFPCRVLHYPTLSTRSNLYDERNIVNRFLTPHLQSLRGKNVFYVNCS